MEDELLDSGSLLFKTPIDLNLIKIKRYYYNQEDFFLFSGGDQEDYHPHRFSGIEMVSVQTYVSLKDVLQYEPPPPEILHMKWSRRDSWREIPIRDPLVQHAARAYLLPMEPPAANDDDRKCLGNLKDGCCGFLGYLLKDVVLGGVRRLFGGENVTNGGGEDDVKVD